MMLLPANGFRCVLGPGTAQREAFLAPLRHLEPGLDLRNSPAGLEWMAELEMAGGKVLLFEFEFATGSGKTSRVHVRTVLAVSAGIAEIGRLPGFVAVRLPWLERRAVRKSEMQSSALAAIAKAWSLFGDAATGARFFTQRVQEELARSPKGESWCIGGGWACCVFRDYLDADNLAVFLERSQRVMTME